MKNTVNKFLILSASISLIIIFYSCSNYDNNKNDLKIIKNYFKNKHNEILNDNTDKIFVIADVGCSTCSKEFADFASGYLSDTSSLFLITGDGTMFDITPFENSKKNIFFDLNINRSEYKILSGAKVIFLDKNKIDTVITINSREIRNQINFLSDKLLLKHNNQ